MRGAPPLTQFSASIDAVYWDARSSCPIVLDYIVFLYIAGVEIDWSSRVLEASGA